MKIGILHQLLGCVAFSRRYKANSFPMFRFYQAHGFRDIAVVRNRDCAVVDVPPPVVQEMRGEIHVRPLFLGFDDFGVSWSVAGIGERQGNLMP